MAVRATADDDLVDLHVAPFLGRTGVFGQVRERNGRFQRGEVYFDRALVFRVGVRLEYADLALESAV